MGVHGQKKARVTCATGTDVASVALYALTLAASAVLMAFAIESPRLWWLGWITLLPLLQAARSLRPVQGLVAGCLWGAMLFVSAVSLTQTGIQPTVYSLGLLSLIPGLYVYFGAKLTRQIGFSPYLLALGWIGVEFCLRPVGFEHGLLAGTQGDGVLIRVVGSFAGYAIVAFLVAYINASLLSVLHEVRCCLALPRLIASSADAPARLITTDTPYVSSYMFRISLPRAPPNDMCSLGLVRCQTG